MCASPGRREGRCGWRWPTGPADTSCGRWRPAGRPAPTCRPRSRSDGGWRMRSTIPMLALAALISAAPARADDTLYGQLGGQPGLVRLMDDFMPRLLADAPLAPLFK